MHPSAFENFRYQFQVPVGKIRAASNANLTDFQTLEILHGFDLTRTVGACNLRNDVTHVDLDHPVVGGLFIGGEFDPFFFSPLSLEKSLCVSIAWENRGGYA